MLPTEDLNPGFAVDVLCHDTVWVITPAVVCRTALHVRYAIACANGVFIRTRIKQGGVSACVCVAIGTLLWELTASARASHARRRDGLSAAEATLAPSACTHHSLYQLMRSVDEIAPPNTW